MKIVKETLESLLAETDDIYVRFEYINGAKALVAGGISKKGMWLEFPIILSVNITLTDITRSLKVMNHVIVAKHKRWHVEDINHSLIRQIVANLN